ncbi:MAG: TRAP transporter small permease [Rhodospirillum sp.]|nr:TRAP transporter small permease [Rhodospirillum sp.]MCF8489407.1 TRAP transporter small permease [Rhodospirillum sp.]
MEMVDRLSGFLARVAAVLYLGVGVMLGWEVGGRYLFNAPTIWAEELSRLFLVWGTLLGASWLIKGGRHIRITMVLEHLGEGPRRVLEILSLLFVIAFAVGLIVYGSPIALDSLERGRTTGSMIDLPIGLVQISVPIGGLLMTLQAGVEILRLVLGGPLSLLSHDDDASEGTV